MTTMVVGSGFDSRAILQTDSEMLAGLRNGFNGFPNLRTRKTKTVFCE